MKIIKMKFFLTIAYLAFFTISLYAQDLIVTNQGDSLNCKITKVNPDCIYFTFKYNDEIRNTLLPNDQVVLYQKNYYSTAEVPADKIKGNEIYPHFRFAVSGGWSYRTASLSSSVPADFKDYMKKLKSGFNYELGLTYYFTEILGAGLKYNEFLSSNEIEDVYVNYLDGTTDYGNMSDNIRIKFIGPLFSYRLLNSTKKNCLLIDFSAGYLDYHNKGSLVSNPVVIKGGTIGSQMTVGYDIGISEKLAIGFQLALSTGMLTQLTYSYGGYKETVKLEKDNYENLSRIDLSVGLRFNK